MSAYIGNLPSTSRFTSPFTLIPSTIRCSRLSTSPLHGHPKDGSSQPSYHQPTTTAYLLSLRLQPPTERPFPCRSATCVRAKIVRSCIPASTMSPTIRTAEGGLRWQQELRIERDALGVLIRLWTGMPGPGKICGRCDCYRSESRVVVIKK
jgi:hypothetical protein